MRYRRFSCILCSFILGFILFGVGLICCETRSSAEINLDYVRKENSIGFYQDGRNGESVPGVKVTLDGQTLGFCLDTWKKDSNGQWNYCGSNQDGELSDLNIRLLSDNLIWTTGTREDPSRFGFIIPYLNKTVMRLYNRSMPEDFSVVYRAYKKGELVNKNVEYSYDNTENLKENANSLIYYMRKKTSIYFSDYGIDGTSYFYAIHSALSIGEEGDVTVDAMDFPIAKEGKAYFDGENYIIKELPELSLEREGYTCKLQGWYNQSGEKRYTVGSSINKGDHIIPKITVTGNPTEVRCVDVIQTDDSIVLGESSITRPCGSLISGSEFGNDSRLGIYYEGTRYVGCTSKEITVSDDNIVYRYFVYGDYSVSVIDKAISKEDDSEKILGNTTRVCQYGSFVSGADLLGDSQAEGEYYRGYRFTESTEIFVNQAGMEVYRYFEPIVYTVNFHGNSATGGNMLSMDCEYGRSYELIPNRYKRIIYLDFDLQKENANYNSMQQTISLAFEGWSVQNDGQVEYADNAQIRNLCSTTSEINLYAIWGEVDYEIQEIPTCMGYSFAGWALEEDADVGNRKFSLLDNTTLYAIWKPSVVSYHVEYYKEDLEGSYEMVSRYTFSDYTEQEIVLQNLVDLYPGFYYDASSSKVSGIVQPDGSLILSVYYRRNEYTLNFDLNGGSWDKDGLVEEIQGKYGCKVEIPSVYPYKEGYDFIGWGISPENIKVYCKQGDPFTMPNHDQTLYACYEAKKYQISLRENADYETVVNEEVDYNQQYTLPQNKKERLGYYFEGWVCQGEKEDKIYKPGDTINIHDNAIFEGKWKPIEGSIHFEMNVPAESQSSYRGYVEDIDFVYGKTCIMPEDRYELDGYTFEGWNTKADGSGEMVHIGDDISQLFYEEKNNLYSIWKANKNTRFVIVYYDAAKDFFDSRSFEGETDSFLEQYKEEIEKGIEGYDVQWDDSIAQQRIPGDGSGIYQIKVLIQECQINIWDNPDKKEQYDSQKGYFQDKVILPTELVGFGGVNYYGDDNKNIYEAGKEFTFKGNLDLYPMHKVTYINDDNVETYMFHGYPEHLAKIEEKGFPFLGWYYDESCKDFAGNAGDCVQFEDDRCLYGKWGREPITYRIHYQLGDLKGIYIIDGQTDWYHYGDNIILPVDTQVVVPEGYRFGGWYEASDSERKIVSEIKSTDYGDKVYHILIEKVQSPSKEKEELQPTENPDIQSTEKPCPTNEPNIQVTEKPVTQATQQPEIQVTKKPDVQVSEKPANNHASSGNKLEIQNNDKENIQNNNNELWINNIQYHMITIKSKKSMAITGYRGKTSVVRIPDYVSLDGKKYIVTMISSKAFYKKKNIKKIYIGKNISSIGKKAFYCDKKLRSVVVNSKKIKTIGKKAFGKNKKISFRFPKVKKAKYKYLLKKSR